MTITPNLEKTLLNFASYVTIIGREAYGNAIKQALLLPEPAKTEQLDILKGSITEIFDASDESEFHWFVQKYNLRAEDIKEFLEFLGPDSSLSVFGKDDAEDVYITIYSYLKTKIEEKILDKIVLLMKLKLGKKYWDSIEFSEITNESFQNFISHLQRINPDISNYVLNTIKLELANE